MRFIYSDEAGTSRHEPVTVVVGLIVDGDKQLVPAIQAMKGLGRLIPEKYRKGFAFHAKNIWGDNKYRQGWPEAERVTLLTEMMSIPSRLGIPVAWCAASKDGTELKAPVAGIRRAEDIAHMEAFSVCLATADKYIRDHCPNEVATAVAEDVPEKRQLLRRAAALLTRKPFVVPDGIVPGKEGPQEHSFYITQIVDAVHFAERQNAVMLQIADACAYALRRYFAGKEHGDEWCRLFFGADLPAKLSGDQRSCGVVWRA